MPFGRERSPCPDREIPGRCDNPNGCPNHERKRIGDLTAMNRLYSRLKLRGVWIVFLAPMLIVVAEPRGEARLADRSRTTIRYGETANGYVYMNGGWTANEQSSMEQLAESYNVKVVLVPPKGLPLSPLRVLIANNGTRKIDAISLAGPWLYFQLPPGSYTIVARIRDNLFVLRDVQVEDSGRQTHILGVSLPRSSWNPSQPGARE